MNPPRMIDDPSYRHHPQHQQYLQRVQELEAQGLTTSDAQSIADMEWQQHQKFGE
jgi:uncharacterized protein YoaH (UPF0181 family)